MLFLSDLAQFTYVGVVDFSAYATHITHLGTYYTAAEVQNAVSTMPYYGTDRTNIAAGITAMRDLQFNAPADAQNIAILLKSSTSKPRR